MKKQALIPLREDDLLPLNSLETVMAGEGTVVSCLTNKCKTNSGTCQVNKCENNAVSCQENECKGNYPKVEIGQ